jgi:hypothetical protein
MNAIRRHIAALLYAFRVAHWAYRNELRADLPDGHPEQVPF